MLGWGTRRKFAIIGIAALIVVLILTWYGSVKFYSPPSCTDGKQNQGEQGEDCGGPCMRLCPNQAPDLIVRWQRSLPVAGGAYNAVAYIENTNPRLGSEEVSYVFKLYNEDSVLVAERAGTASIPPQRITPIFEGDIRTGNRSPFRTVFEFEGTPVWESLSAVGPEVVVSDQRMRDTDTLPLLTARLLNSSSQPLRDVEIITIVYDTENNARAVSKTVLERVPALGSETMLFSWPSAFGFTIGRIEIVPRLYPGINY